MAATDVAVAHGFAIAVFRLVEEGAVEAVLQNRSDGGDRTCLDRDAAPASGVHAGIVLGPGQGEDSEAGSKALFRMGPVGHDRLEQRGDRGDDFFAVGDQTRWRP